MFQGY